MNTLKSKKMPFFIILAVIIIIICAINYGFGIGLAEYTVAAVFAAFFAVEDIETMHISSTMLLVMLGVSIVVVGVSFDTELYISSAVSGGVMFVVLMVMHFITMRGLGMGDVKLVSIVSFLIGFTDAMQLMFTTLILTVVVGIVICIIKKGSLKSELPMIPGFMAAMLINNLIILAARR